MGEEFKDKFAEVGALWETKSKKGWSGNLTINGTKTSILVFPNRTEGKANAPLYKIFVAKDKMQEPAVPAPSPDNDDGSPF